MIKDELDTPVNAISRRALLRSAAVIGGTALFNQRTSQAKPTGQPLKSGTIPITQHKVSVSKCKDLKSYVRSTGLRVRNQHYKDYWGLVLYEPITINLLDPSKLNLTNMNDIKKFFTPILQNVKFSTSGNCLTVRNLQVAYQPTITARRIEWTPPCFPCEACENSWKRTAAFIERHERQHINDVLKTIRNRNKQWNKASFRRCGPNAIDDILLDIVKQIQKDMNAIVVDIYSDKNKLHAKEYPIFRKKYLAKLCNPCIDCIEPEIGYNCSSVSISLCLPEDTYTVRLRFKDGSTELITRSASPSSPKPLTASFSGTGSNSGKTIQSVELSSPALSQSFLYDFSNKMTNCEDGVPDYPSTFTISYDTTLRFTKGPWKKSVSTGYEEYMFTSEGTATLHRVDPTSIGYSNDYAIWTGFGPYSATIKGKSTENSLVETTEGKEADKAQVYLTIGPHNDSYESPSLSWEFGASGELVVPVTISRKIGDSISTIEETRTIYSPTRTGHNGFVGAVVEPVPAELTLSDSFVRSETKGIDEDRDGYPDVGIEGSTELTHSFNWSLVPGSNSSPPGGPSPPVA